MTIIYLCIRTGISCRHIAVSTNMMNSRNTLCSNRYEIFYFVHCPRKADKCPTIFCLGRTFGLPSKIIICRSAIELQNSG